jgi:hypothetical protein
VSQCPSGHLRLVTRARSKIFGIHLLPFLTISAQGSGPSDRTGRQRRDLHLHSGSPRSSRRPSAAAFTAIKLVGALYLVYLGLRALLLLGVLFNCVGVVWLLAYAELSTRARALLTHPRVKRTLDRLSGVALVALGARLAPERN